MRKHFACLLLSFIVIRLCAASAPAVPCWVFLESGYESQYPAEKALQPTGKALQRRALRGNGEWPEWIDRPLPVDWIEAVESTGVDVRTQSRWLRAVSVLATEQQQERLRTLPGVRELCPVLRGRRVTQPDLDASHINRLQYGDSQTQLEQIGVPTAHDRGLSGSGVLVLMIDSGYYKDHEALDESRVVGEWDFIFDDGDTQNGPEDIATQHNHGTATATALGAHVPGVLYGPAYNCSYLLAKTEDLRSETPIEEDYLVAALEWGEPLGADLASISLGYTDWYLQTDLDGQTAVCTQGVNQAIELGMVVVTSAGNSRVSDWGAIGTPADAFEVISTGAVDSAGELMYFSSPGPTADGRIKPEVVAMGGGVWCAGTDNVTHYRTAAGTSLSCPLVAGSAALILEAHPDWTPGLVRRALMFTADRAGAPDNDFGWGLVNLPAALDFQPGGDTLQISLQAGQLVLCWNAGLAQSYIVRSSDCAYGPFETVVAATADTMLVIQNVIGDATRFYQVRAFF